MNLSNLVSNLRGIFKGSSIEGSNRRNGIRVEAPVLEINVKGFEATLEKKDGVLLHYKAENEGSEKKPASIGSYYEVTVRSTGENPDYPESEKPVKMKLTKSLDRGMGFSGNTSFVSSDIAITKIVVEEKYSSGDPVKEGIMGAYPSIPYPPHHTAHVSVYGVGSDNKEYKVLGAGLMTRKSDMEKPEWERAKNSPTINYL
ncbi:MAG: hypothetical protein WC989_03240 [Micavibrio sp.]